MQPIVELSEFTTQLSKQQKIFFPFRVELVVRSLDDAREKRTIFFETRIHPNMTEMKFQLYLHSIHRKTFYPAHRPYQIISETIFEYKKKIQEKQEKWKAFFIYWWRRFLSLGERKTRMQREHKIQTWE